MVAIPLIDPQATDPLPDILNGDAKVALVVLDGDPVDANESFQPQAVAIRTAPLKPIPSTISPSHFQRYERAVIEDVTVRIETASAGEEFRGPHLVGCQSDGIEPQQVIAYNQIDTTRQAATSADAKFAQKGSAAAALRSIQSNNAGIVHRTLSRGVVIQSGLSERFNGRARQTTKDNFTSDLSAIHAILGYGVESR